MSKVYGEVNSVHPPHLTPGHGHCVLPHSPVSPKATEINDSTPPSASEVSAQFQTWIVIPRVGRPPGFRLYIKHAPRCSCSPPQDQEKRRWFGSQANTRTHTAAGDAPTRAKAGLTELLLVARKDIPTLKVGSQHSGTSATPVARNQRSLSRYT